MKKLLSLSVVLILCSFYSPSDKGVIYTIHNKSNFTIEIAFDYMSQGNWKEFHRVKLTPSQYTTVDGGQYLPRELSGRFHNNCKQSNFGFSNSRNYYLQDSQVNCRVGDRYQYIKGIAVFQD